MTNKTQIIFPFLCKKLKKNSRTMSAMMDRNQNVQQNQQQTVQDVFTKEKIMPHCTKIEELLVR